MQFSSGRGETEITKVKTRVTRTWGIGLFSRERGKTQITQSKIALPIQTVRCHFPRKDEELNIPPEE